MSSEGDTIGRALDATPVDSTLHLDEATVTPLLVPGILDEPVRGTVLDTPANDFDSMATESATSGVRVHARLVSGKVLVDSDGDRQTTMSHERLLHRLDRPCREGRLRLGLVALVVLAVVRLGALLRA